MVKKIISIPFFALAWLLLFNTVTAQNLPAIWASVLEVADINGDGKDDIFIAGYGNSQQYVSGLYKRNGSNYQTVSLPNNPFDYIGAVAFGDYDGDGDPDLAVSGYVESNDVSITRIYKNTNGSFSMLGFSGAGITRGEMEWADIDGDGDEDLLIAGMERHDFNVSKVVTNQGNGNFTETEGQFPGGLVALAVADINGDGRSDVMSGGTDRNQRPFLRFFVASGGSQFARQPAWDERKLNGDIDWGDFDGDGDKDLLALGTPGAGLGIYRNDGGNNFTLIAPDSAHCFTGNARWNDYDQDGDLDFALISENRQAPVCRIYKNNGNATFTLAFQNLPVGTQGKLRWLDAEGDGDADLVLSGFRTTGNFVTIVYQNNGQF